MKKTDLILAVNAFLLPAGKRVDSVTPIAQCNLVDGIPANTICHGELFMKANDGQTGEVELRLGTETEYERIRQVSTTDSKPLGTAMFNQVAVLNNADVFFTGYQISIVDITV